MAKRKAAYMQITRRCNNECIFCSNPQFEKEPSLKELTEQIKKFLKDGVTEIVLTGGEPTLSPHLFEIIKFTISNGVDVKMISNGTSLSDEKLAKKIKNAGLKHIHISIHHHLEETGDIMSQRQGNWKKTVEGIKNALNSKIIVDINCTINSYNSQYLSEMFYFFITEFPQVNHYVINNLDPGDADGLYKSRAGQNPKIIPKFVDLECELSKTVALLIKNNKTFRIERVPLCYMHGFEEYSTETRKIIKGEEYICAFLRPKDNYEIRKVSPIIRRLKSECCKICKLNEICAGIQKEYAAIYGLEELFPVFSNPNHIKNKILGKKNE